MKTCIVKGFVDKAAQKYYYYHGIYRGCNCQFDPECFVGYDTENAYLPPKTKTFTADLYTSYEACDWGYLTTRNRLTGSYAYTIIGQTLEDLGGDIFVAVFREWV